MRGGSGRPRRPFRHLPAEKIGEAQTLRATIRARGTGIAKPEISCLGLKFQFLVFDAMTGMTLYPNTHTVRHGSFGSSP